MHWINRSWSCIVLQFPKRLLKISIGPSVSLAPTVSTAIVYYIQDRECGHAASLCDLCTMLPALPVSFFSYDYKSMLTVKCYFFSIAALVVCSDDCCCPDTSLVSVSRLPDLVRAYIDFLMVRNRDKTTCKRTKLLMDHAFTDTSCTIANDIFFLLILCYFNSIWLICHTSHTKVSHIDRVFDEQVDH